jgi:hypothetical protein
MLSSTAGNRLSRATMIGSEGVQYEVTAHAVDREHWWSTASPKERGNTVPVAGASR